MKIESDCLETSGSFVFIPEKERSRHRPEMKDKEVVGVSQAAFWGLIEPVKLRLYNFILKSLNFSTDADDVYQETVLHAFQYFASFRKDKDFRAWIFSVAHNEIKSHFRRTREHTAVHNIDSLASPQADETGALIREVFRFAARLKPKEREVFFLYYESGFSIPEIREITGLKEGYIKLLLSQARNNLKEALGVHHG
ncbi:MAG: RNA polymerase sigma factor [Candidatus Aminicenantes bacterium]|nr:RNA polymerase sigma factor [Candidatus Aminicenantes bacterium]